ncbi:MAG: glycosyl transferase group 1 [Bacteroidetes bacterium]|nr:glycosyl transferase group 1 [Bacteroidota bacterium]
MNLFLFANFFPYKRAEPFLVNEFEFAKSKSDSVTIITLYGNPSDSILTEDKKIRLLRPVFENASNKRAIWINGIFNLAPFGLHLAEFFSKGLLFKPKQLYWFFISLFITRTALSSHAYKELLQKLNNTEKAVLYFYWGDNLCWTIPYLKKKIRNKNVKIVLRLHGSDLYEHMKSGYAPLRQKTFTCVDAIFTVAKNGADYLKQRYPDQAHKISVAPLGVFDNGLNPHKEDEFIIVSASNVVPVKRVKLLLEALKKSDLKVTWQHFGDGPLFHELKVLSEQGRQGLKIVLHGHVLNKDLITFYKTNSVDVFVNVSSSEGLPVSIMEALSFGIPVIATGVGGTPELVNDNVGTILDPGVGPDQLSLALAQFFQLSDEERAVKRKNAREQFLLKASAEKNYNNFYELISHL